MGTWYYILLGLILVALIVAYFVVRRRV